MITTESVGAGTLDGCSEDGCSVSVTGGSVTGIEAEEPGLAAALMTPTIATAPARDTPVAATRAYAAGRREC